MNPKTTPQSGPAKKPQPPAEPPLPNALVPIAQKQVTLMLEAGYLLMEMKKHKQAEEIFNGVMSLLPNSEVPHMAMGNLFFSQGRFQPAYKSHLKATELNPHSATALASVAESLFFLKRSPEALEHLDAALKHTKDTPGCEFARALKEAYDLGIFKD